MSDPFIWSLTLLSSLYENGVRHAIISPGSRSTPLTLAAAIHPGIQKRVVLDERSAAFIALGIGKTTGNPAVLICTSGTALANYFPAVVEAKESGVPMIILSADRPPNLRGLGSSQTIDQIKIFGNQAVFFHEAGEPASGDTDLKRIAYAAKQAAEFSVDLGGAAQINLPFRKPLEPDAALLQEQKEKLANSLLKDDQPKTVNTSSISLDDSISELITSSKRPLIIAGPADPSHALSEQVKTFSKHLQAPVLAEPGSQIDNFDNTISDFDLFIRDKNIRKKLQPDLVIRFGDQPYSSSLLWVLEAWEKTPVIHITARNQTQDHSMTVSHKILCKKHDSIELVNIPPNTEENWMDTWFEFQEKAKTKLHSRLSENDKLTDGHVFDHISKQISENWNVMLSNSLPVRDMLTFGKSYEYQFINRGAAGIDGILSTALGIHFSSDRPTCCLIGDLAFFHDSNALYTLQKVSDQPFVAIVINNQGGNIFQMLPVHRIKEKAAPKEIYQTYFETPQKTDISHLAKASGIDYRKIDSLSALKETNLNEIKGLMIFECVTDKKASMDLRIDLLTSS